MSLFYNTVRRCFCCKNCDFFWELEKDDPISFGCPVCDSRCITQVDSAGFDKWLRIKKDSDLYRCLYDISLERVWSMADEALKDVEPKLVVI